MSPVKLAVVEHGADGEACYKFISAIVMVIAFMLTVE